MNIHTERPRDNGQNSKSEARNSKQVPNPKSKYPKRLTRAWFWGSVIRAFDLFRISLFGFRASGRPLAALAALLIVASVVVCFPGEIGRRAISPACGVRVCRRGTRDGDRVAVEPAFGR